MDKPNDQPKLLNGVISIAPTTYIDALLKLDEKLEGKKIAWAVSGDLGEILRTVNVEPDCIEIHTSREAVEKIVEAALEFKPIPAAFVTQQLPRSAVFQGKEHPIYLRSYYSEFNIGVVKVKIYGDAQYRLDNWEWGDKVEFIPDIVYVVGKKIAVMPLSFKHEFYLSVGWQDRAEKIKQTLDRQRTN